MKEQGKLAKNNRKRLRPVTRQNGKGHSVLERITQGRVAGTTGSNCP